MSGFAERLARPELMDDANVDPVDLAANFRDIEFANAVFGGAAPVVREVLATGARTVLDVGCGSADIPRAVVRAAARLGRDVWVTCADRSAAVLDIARRRSLGDPKLSFVQAEALELPFRDRSFDVATCSLTLHHFDPHGAVALLRELRRVARIPIVCDLVRSRTAYLATRLFARVLAHNRLTRHDAPLSVQRAYTAAEALELAREAGWEAASVTAEPYFRMVLRDG